MSAISVSSDIPLRQPDSRRPAVRPLLSAGQLAQILLAMEEVRPHGEVHLVIREGELRFLRLVRSIAVRPEDDRPG